MCEIFIIDPQDNDAEIIETNARDMFESNPDGIGLVAIYRDGEKFDYEIYKAPDYNGQAVGNFIRKHDEAWRMVVHARLATHGDTQVPQTHPIEADCDHEGCDVQMVVHNGVVNAEKTWRETLTDEGHDFNTFVDSEVILHEHGSLSQDIEDIEETELGGSLNYILFQEDAILLRSGYSYADTEEFVMGKKKRCEWDGSSKSTKFLLATPDGEVQKSKKASRSSSGSQGWYGSRGRRSGTRGWSSRNQSGSRSGSSGSSSSDRDDRVGKGWRQWKDWPPEEEPKEAS